MRRTRIGVVLGVCVMVVAGGCGRREHGTKVSGETPGLVAGHSSGMVSTADPIRVRFTRPIVPESRVGLPLAESPFEVSPRVRGEAVWSGTRTLELQPVEPLKPGRRYTVELDLSQLMETPPDAERFVFELTTVEQSFEVEVSGFAAAGDGSGRMVVEGELTTADTARPEKVEAILRARQEGRDLEIVWRHDDAGRVHRFVIRGVRRGEEGSRINVEWNGHAIGAHQRGETVVPVPAAEEFAVTRAAAVTEPGRFIEVRFTDPLAPDQDLEGLVRVEGHDELRFSLEGNVLRIDTTGSWEERETLILEPSVRGRGGVRLGRRFESEIVFGQMKPRVRFTGSGVIVPTSGDVSIPIETANISSLTVRAVRVFGDNVPQFLQVNQLEGEREIDRVGRVVWEETLSLDDSEEARDRWARYGLDLTPLIDGAEGGFYRLELSFDRRGIMYACEQGLPGPEDGAPADPDEMAGEEAERYWQWWQRTAGGGWSELWRHRDDPCHPGYYRGYGADRTETARNVLLSDIGLIAKSAGDELMVAATDLGSAQPLRGAQVTILDYQQRPVAEGRTAANGLVVVEPEREPYLAVVRHEGQVGYLRLDDGSALPVSRFDVAGAEVEGAIGGFVYGERGVWRPGDTIHLTLILHDPHGELPDEHPVKLELEDSRGRVIERVTRTEGLNGFYTFHVTTAPDAPTGRYTARFRVGGRTFTHAVPVETVRPNRLDIELDIDGGMVRAPADVVTGVVSAEWLHGASAADLEADVEMTVRGGRTSFPGFEAYTFADPTRPFDADSQTVFEGRLDGRGEGKVKKAIDVSDTAPGMLDGSFKMRVFEPGGAFSTEYATVPVSPYERYIGALLPEGEGYLDRLSTGTDHDVALVAVTEDGEPVTAEVEIDLYHIHWRWWWEKGRESLADFAVSEQFELVRSDRVVLDEGRGSWTLRMDEPAWGRYLLLVADADGGHRTGEVVYVGWPRWGGGDQPPAGAAMLTLSTDKDSYAVGDRVRVTVPTGERGRALVTLESSQGVVRSEWIVADGEPAVYEFEAEPEMVPNVYVGASYLQPHGAGANDRPIRMYGVVPVKIVDTDTELQPVVELPEVLRPESEAEIVVREAAGRSMTYTVAVVDEGLLNLTGFATPDPWEHFFRRRALSVKTWDLFDQVAGAYGGVLERLFAVGGGMGGPRTDGRQRANRFPPMVRFLGPFHLESGASGRHTLEVPRYVGSVRAMVVAGADGAYGSAEARAPVRTPLMVLGTLPRVLGLGETVELPVTVFAMEDGVETVRVGVTTDGPLAPVGQTEQSVTFDEPGRRTAMLRLKTADRTGVGRVEIEARGGGERARQTIEIDVASPMARVADVAGSVVRDGERWRRSVTLPGVPGTNEATLEVSTAPPLDLERRLGWLIRYPHGCVEQVTSAVFPQLYLNALVELGEEELADVESNVRTGIDRLRSFQTGEGGFSYWPSGAGSFGAAADSWASSYAGHFLLEAERAGYFVPTDMLNDWRRYQRRRARSWITGADRGRLEQAYRLYTLALAAAPELGAMNRLRESRDLPVAARWRLAAAYHLAGRPEAARRLVRGAPTSVAPYRELAGTYGSDLRDRAMILEALFLMDDLERARGPAEVVADALSGDRWLSTQTTAYALMAMSRYVALTVGGEPARFRYRWADGERTAVEMSRPVVRRDLPVGEVDEPEIELENRGDVPLYVRLVVSGVPKPGSEWAASNGLELTVAYETVDGDPFDPVRVVQGTDFKAVVTVTNTGHRGTYEELALSHVVAPGWEIHNERLAGGARPEGAEYRDIRDDRVYTYFDLDEGKSKAFELLVNAAYAGRFYLPMVSVEAMYDAAINARRPGRWIEIVRPEGGD